MSVALANAPTRQGAPSSRHRARLSSALPNLDAPHAAPAATAAATDTTCRRSSVREPVVGIGMQAKKRQPPQEPELALASLALLRQGGTGHTTATTKWRGWDCAACVRSATAAEWRLREIAPPNPESWHDSFAASQPAAEELFPGCLGFWPICLKPHTRGSPRMELAQARLPLVGVPTQRQQRARAKTASHSCTSCWAAGLPPANRKFLVATLILRFGTSQAGESARAKEVGKRAVFSLDANHLHRKRPPQPRASSPLAAPMRRRRRRLDHISLASVKGGVLLLL